MTHLKKIAALLLVLLLAQAGLAQQHSLTIVNKTGYDIKALYLAPTSPKAFVKGDELLEGDVLKNGQTVEITYTGNAKIWDLLVSWKDGSGDVEWEEITLVSGGKYALLYNSDSEETSLKKL